MKTIEEATPLLPIIIASNVREEVRHLNPGQGAVERLAARAEEHYRNSVEFRRKLRGAKGREWLYAFMRHWLAAELVKAGCAREALPEGWANGQPAR